MTGSLIPEVLEDYAARTRAVIADTLPDAEPHRYLYGPVADYPGRGGKMLRPALCIAAARAFGAPQDLAVALAASIELLHNALLIHDDIEDESETRRGAPALHVLHGTAIAVNAGDMLAFLSLRPVQALLPRLGPALSAAVLGEFDRVARETAEGQALELGWRFDNLETVTRGDYLNMVLKKTCWLTSIFPCRLGATLGMRQGQGPARFVRFGFFAGAAFQIKDDLMNIEHHALYGKELCGDLHEGKRTLMLIDLISGMSPRDRARLMAFLATPRADRSDRDVAWIRGRMQKDGCIARAEMAAQTMVAAACAEFERAFAGVPDSRDRRFIQSLPAWMLARTH